MEIPIRVVVPRSRSAGGFWAEVTAFPGCVSEGESMDALRTNIKGSIECWLSLGRESPPTPDEEDDDGPPEVIT